MKKILFIGTTNIYGGVGHIMFDYCNLLKKRGYQFDFLYYEKPTKEELDIIEGYGSSFFLSPKYSRNPVSFYRFIKDFYSKNKYDIVHIHASTGMLMMYALPVWKSNVRIVYQSHVDRVMGALNNILHKLFIGVVNKYSDVKLAVSSKAASFMYKKSSSEAVIITNGINVSQYSFDDNVRNLMRTQLKIEDNTVIGVIGRFSKIKNHRFMIEVFDKYLKKNRKSKLLLVGKGEEELEIKQFVSSLGIDDKVIFYGTTREVYKILNVMDCMLFASLGEGLGIVAIEAQASGLPVIASDQVPTEAGVTDLFVSLGLEEPIDKWVEAIENALNTTDRLKYNEIVMNSGYSLEKSVDALINMYNKDNLI